MQNTDYVVVRNLDVNTAGWVYRWKDVPPSNLLTKATCVTLKATSV